MITTPRPYRITYLPKPGGHVNSFYPSPRDMGTDLLAGARRLLTHDDGYDWAATEGLLKIEVIDHEARGFITIWER